MVGSVASLALAPAAWAQTINNDETSDSMMYNPSISLTSLSQNSFTGTVGGVFYTPYYFNTTINYLGYADPTDAPLVDSHTVTIWTDGTENIVAQAVVPSGTPTLWADGYAWVQLPSAVTLTYQHYYAIGATVVGGVDPWGNLIYNTSGSQDTGSGGEITWNVAPNGYGSGNQDNGPFVQAGTGWEFAKVGAYTSGTTDPDDSSDGGARTSQTDSIYSAPNMGYNIVATPVPEPATLSIAGLGTAFLLGLGLKRKSKIS